MTSRQVAAVVDGIGAWRRWAPWLAILSSLACTGAVAEPSPSSDAEPASVNGDAGTPPEDVAFEGRVVAYLLAPDAGVAGLVFDDGRQVFVPPHLGARLAALVRPGQQARIGPPAESARGPASLRTITAVASGATLAETPADAARPPPAAERGSRALHAARAAGTIRLRLHGPRGETNGLLLDSGTEVFFPPHVANEAGAWLWPGRPITVEGYGQTSSYGTVLQATTIVGPNGQTVAVFGAPR